MIIAKVNIAANLQTQVSRWKNDGLKVGLVPTMGALHAGHLSLVKRILQDVDRVVVSIFVNPTQFGEGEDFANYPRNRDADCAKLLAAGAHLVYLPKTFEIYGDNVTAGIQAGPLGQPLCGRFRPGHFDGVATVVTRLFQQCQPDMAIFGEKDFQQLRIIQTLVVDLPSPVKILSGPIIRENDGLAMSSRNAYLTPDERRVAVALPRILKQQIAAAGTDANLRAIEKAGTAALLKAGFDSVDYMEFRDAKDLSLTSKVNNQTRLFVAAYLGKTRLIDNMKVE